MKAFDAPWTGSYDQFERQMIERKLDFDRIWGRCRECFQIYKRPTRGHDDGFCSDSCEQLFAAEIADSAATAAEGI